MEGIPVSVAINQFRQQLIADVNSSGLHISIVEMILSDVYAEVKSLAEQVARQEEEQYSKEDNNAES